MTFRSQPVMCQGRDTNVRMFAVVKLQEGQICISRHRPYMLLTVCCMYVSQCIHHTDAVPAFLTRDVLTVNVS